MTRRTPPAAPRADTSGSSDDRVFADRPDDAPRAARPGHDPVRHRRAQAALARLAKTLDAGLDALDTPASAPATASPGTSATKRPRRRRNAVVIGRLSAPGWTPAAQRGFVEHLAVHGCVDQAARHVGLSRQSAYQLRQRMPNSMFALAWDTAMMLALRSLIDIATERAIHGRAEEVWSRGEMVGTRVVHNDRMLMFVLGHKPEPLHPTLSPAELHQLWPTMLREIDAVLPPVMNKEDAKLRIAAQGDIGND